ncbi:HAMP domain-containing sensor histidine kinase [Pelagicoccus sp. SDUM812005]|uniref:sensor histidine kinase n=1 Tax=Pelagicoccus sp. SDUM812005 TaxID=3041257 RepID=UPI00281045D4|nr:HAMP domain-containing sensor histidine kinase [Pelagicoccus sp. SDUM812005]MDQ8181912.1 HAMP domain-containing sensor histidine kinase [Pelagicoccus sp. SDUM812005]
MNRLSNPTLAWILLGASALTLAALTLFSIYREEKGDAQRRAELIEQQQTRLTEKLASYLSEIQLQTGRSLVAFHQEGLPGKLRQWSQGDPLISDAYPLPPHTDWQPLLHAESPQIIHLESPDAPSALRSGYYQDNKEIALREEGAIEPILFWYFDRQAEPPSWTAGHRIAKGQPMRIVKLDTATLRTAFQTLLAELAIPDLKTEITPATADQENSLSDILPGYALTLTLAPNPDRKLLNTLSYTVVGLTLAIGILCGILIARRTAKERHEALRKTTFVSQISHEFKTPLTNISLYSDLLANEGIPPEKRSKYLDTISRESLRLSELVDNILALNAIESGKKKYKIKELPLHETIEAILADYTPTLQAADMQATWIRLDSPLSVRFDPAALRQILLNLLDNARKYAAAGKQIQISCAQTDRCVLRIEDKGPGIPSHLRQKIFEAFYQKQSTLTEKSPGAGIGLSLSRRMARDCQGELSLDSNYSQGARFLLEIPLA